jgi:hypothetical protein
MPVPDRPTAFDRLRGMLHGKEGRFIEQEKNLSPYAVERKSEESTIMKKTYLG